MVTILGAGNGGIALACYFEQKGINATVWNRGIDRIKKIIENNNIIEIDDYELSKNYRIKITNVTLDLEFAINKSKYIFIVTTACAHEEIARRLKEMKIRNKLIFLMPGRTLGAKRVMEIINDSSNEYYESQTILHTCRMTDNNLIKYKTKPKLFFSSYNKINRKSLEELITLIPELIYIDNYYDVSLNNIGAMLHPAPTLLNIGLVESKKEFYFYREALSPVVVRYIEKMEEERKKICESYQAKFVSVYEWLKIEYDTFGETLYERLQNNPAYKDILGPTSIDHRYIYDDIKTGLVPLYYLAKEKNIDVPYIYHIIVLANLLMDGNYFEEGRK